MANGRCKPAGGEQVADATRPRCNVLLVADQPAGLHRPFAKNAMSQFADRLADAVRRKGPLCVGIDPRLESLPKALRELPPATAFERFGLRVLELVAPFAGVAKP